jgi:hypothetical protein
MYVSSIKMACEIEQRKVAVLKVKETGYIIREQCPNQQAHNGSQTGRSPSSVMRLMTRRDSSWSLIAKCCTERLSHIATANHDNHARHHAGCQH